MQWKIVPDQQERDRHDDDEPLRRSDELLERPAVLDPVAGRYVHVARETFADLVDERAEVAAAHVGRHEDATFTVLAADLVRPDLERDLCDFR